MVSKKKTCKQRRCTRLYDHSIALVCRSTEEARAIDGSMLQTVYTGIGANRAFSLHCVWCAQELESPVTAGLIEPEMTAVEQQFLCEIHTDIPFRTALQQNAREQNRSEPAR